MKYKLLLLVVTILSFNIIHAQVSFSCTYREFCYWNAVTEKFGNCKGYEENSLFVMNKNESMFSHTIEEMKSTYYVNSKEFDKKNEVYTYDVTSDVGNKYYFIFDPKNKEVRAVFEHDGKTVLLRFTVKAIF